MTTIETQSLIEAARALVPVIQAHGEQIEQERCLPQPVVAALTQAGLFRLLIPRRYGGAEADPATFVRVVKEVSCADGATGWCVMIGGFYGLFAGCLPEPAARAIYGSDPNVVSAGAFRPNGQAVVVDGGYCISGRWPFGSGIQHSPWLVGGCRIFDGDQPCLDARGAPVMRLMFFPAGEAEVIDTWYTAGLHGTGSHDYVVTEVFVPASGRCRFASRRSSRGRCMPYRSSPTAPSASRPCRLVSPATPSTRWPNWPASRRRRRRATCCASTPSCSGTWRGPRRSWARAMPISTRRWTRHGGRCAPAGCSLTGSGRCSGWPVRTPRPVRPRPST
jgi:Acyl-CoA dehydrogenase, N-terminal domain